MDASVIVVKWISISYVMHPAMHPVLPAELFEGRGAMYCDLMPGMRLFLEKALRLSSKWFLLSFLAGCCLSLTQACYSWTWLYLALKVSITQLSLSGYIESEPDSFNAKEAYPK